MSELHLELLLGCEVLDSQGKKAGKVEDARAVDLGDECIITHFLIGRGAVAERLSVHGILSRMLSGFGAKHPGSKTVPWQLLDLSAPDHPRLRCTLEELDRLQFEYQQQPVGP